MHPLNEPNASDPSGSPFPAAANWSPDSWRSRVDPTAKAVVAPYPDEAQVRQAAGVLGSLPPLVTSWEVERLKNLIAQAQEGKRFLLQGGDCAETLDECTPGVITAKLKILLQMSLVLVYAGKKPVIRVGRMAGQYAKPRSSMSETRQVDGQTLTLPSYFGDLINRAPYTLEARTPNPWLMVEGYKHAAMTLNFVRSLLDAGFADIHHPEYWDLGFMRHADLTTELRDEYSRLKAMVGDGLRFMSAMGQKPGGDPQSVEFYTSHEGLNLEYESAQTRTVPRRTGHYNLSTHMPWLGERTRRLDGPHIEYFRGIRNPVGVKIGPSTTAEDLLRLIDAINPADEPGKMVLIPRMGVAKVERVLPGLIDAVRIAGRRVLWTCDPMHGNGIVTSGGVKTRSFDDVLAELEASWDIHRAHGSFLGGVHIELTGLDVTECVGGSAGIRESDLSRSYHTLCDPRLNYEQSLELAFLLARRMQRASDETGARTAMPPAFDVGDRHRH